MTFKASQGRNLHDKLKDFAGALSEGELENYKLLLCMAAGGLAPHGDLPDRAAKANAFRIVLQSLADVQPSGVLWRGRPAFLTELVLSQLQREATLRRATAKATERHFLGCGGQYADVFAMSPQLLSHVRKFAPQMIPTGIASYVYYDAKGCGLDPHIDTEVFSLNMIIMLHHEYGANPSHLLVYHPDGAMERILLTPGEVFLFYAGGTIHAREDMKANESVSLLTIGFQRP